MKTRVLIPALMSLFSLLMINCRLIGQAPCPGMPTVTYQGQVYNTVQIGTQCWFKENLNIGIRIDGTIDQTNNNTIEKYCYSNSESYCDIYGGLYQWEEMMQYNMGEGLQGICPTGWHLPTDAEWTTLTTFLGGENITGGKIKSTGTKQAGTGLWNEPNPASNSSGFTALPAGYRYHNDGSFGRLFDYAYFWTSSESENCRWLLHYSEFLYLGNNHTKMGFSVRCVKDTCPSFSSTSISIYPSQDPVCGGTYVTYTTEAGMTNYIWIVSADGTVISGGTGTDNTVTITWNIAGSQTVSVIYTDTNGCTATEPAVFEVTVNPLPIPTISGPATPCKDTPGYVYTTEPGMNDYSWTVSAGTITAGEGTHSITVTWTSAGSQQVTVNYTDANGCRAITPTVFPVTVLGPTLSGPTTVCKLDPGKTYTTEAGKSGYTWLYSGAVKTAGGNGFNFVTLTWVSSGSRSVKVTYTDGSCTSSTTLPVTVLNSNPSIIGLSELCSNTTAIYYTEEGMVDYQWTVSAGGTIIGSSNTNTVSVNWNNAGVQWISVTYTSPNYCSITPNTLNVSVTLTPNPPNQVIHFSSPTQIIWNWTAVPEATGYKWNTTNDYTTAIDLGNNISRTEPGLTCNTEYTRFVWAYDNFCNSEVLLINQTTSECIFPPISQASNITFSNITTNQFTFNWTDGNGAKRAIFIKQDSIGLSAPVDNITYNANTSYGLGSQIETSGWYCVFNGTTHPSGVTVTNLQPNTNYRVMVCEYNGDSGFERYNISSAINNPLTQKTTYTKLLNLKLYLEGLYVGGGWMYPAMDENGPHWGPSIADKVNIELHSSSNYATIEYILENCTLNSNGTVVAEVPSSFNGSYYITIKHRNSIETTTAAPVSLMGSAPVTYNFTTAAAQAYGDNQKEIYGKWAIWGGDINQDGIVDGSDMNYVDNATTAITFGYVDEDANGDGVVDAGDMNIIDNNTTALIMAFIPDPCIVPQTPTIGTHVPSPTQIVWNWNAVPNALGYKWNTINDYVTAIDMGAATTKTESGLTCNTAYARYVWAYNGCGNSALVNLNQTTWACDGVPCPGTPTVPYGGQTYNTVQIGTQCWFKENLNIGTRIDGITNQTNNSFIEKYCYDNLESNCNIYGGLYQWDEMVQYNIGQGLQGICPSGWHLPTDEEWTTLTTFLGGENVAGGKMKETGTTHWLSPNTGATNESGFTALPGGFRTNNADFLYLGYSAPFWSSTESSYPNAWYRSLGQNYANVNRANDQKTAGYSARCIKDTCSTAPNAPSSNTHDPTQTQIIWYWNNVIGATGYKWSATNDYVSATDMGTSTSKTETGLICNIVYTRYVWAYNGCGNSAPLTMTYATAQCGTLSCGQVMAINHETVGGVAPVTKTTTYGTVTNILGETSKCWITSNLGSDHQSTAVYDATEPSAGWYWQFNRKQGYKHDGTTRTPNTTWISNISETSDWLISNDPCNIELGPIWRIPTYTEWYNVEITGDWIDWNGPWNSGLKLHAAGALLYSDGSPFEWGSYGYYWSSTRYDEANSRLLAFYINGSYMYFDPKAYGFSIRCINEASTSSSTPTVTTTSVSNITQISATSGGNVTSDGGVSVIARGVCWSTSTNPTIADNHTDDGPGTGAFVSNLTSLLANTTYYVRAYATNSIGTAYGNEVTFTTPQPWQCGDTILYSGQSYTTVLIGTQCWMKENLNIGNMINGTLNQTNNSVIEKYCYNNDNYYCEQFGGFYQWNELMQYDTNQGAQGLCPSGWHIPSDIDWCTVTTFIDPTINCEYGGWYGTIAGLYMKSTTDWYNNGNGNNSSGFTALPAGERSAGAPVFSLITKNAEFWSSSHYEGSTTSWIRRLAYSQNGAGRLTLSHNYGLSCRCIKD